MELKSLLSELKLFGMKESIDYRLTSSGQGGLSHEEMLKLLIEDEVLYRTNAKAERLRKKATFKDVVLLSDFDCDVSRGISKIVIKEFQTLNFLKSFENIIFTGGTGAGKSFLAQGIGHCACLSGRSSKFIAVNYLFEQFKAAQKAGQVLTFLKRFSMYEVLILDDLGLSKFTHEEATLLYQIIEDRYRKGSTIITTQILPPGLMDLFDDKVLAEAVIDRLTSNAHIIEVKGPSYRRKQSPKRKISLELAGN